MPRLAVALAVVLVSGLAAWWWWPRPEAPLTLAELQDTYAGMVRSDGTNDASVLTPQSGAETAMTTSPPECDVLIQATVANRLPATALDGVGTYWLGRSTISLFTLRFTDRAAADAELAGMTTALEACAGRDVVVRRGQDGGSTWQARVRRIDSPDRDSAASSAAGADEQVSYLLLGPDATMAIQLMPYLNTLTWQFRYETGTTSYSRLAADQLMAGLRTQLAAVVAARPR